MAQAALLATEAETPWPAEQDAEARIDLLRTRAGVSHKPSKRQQEREEEKLLSQRTSDVIESSQGHVNLFEDLEKVKPVRYSCP